MKFKSLFLFTLLICFSLSSTTANEASDFQQWSKQRTASFNEYKDARDKEFTSFLKLQWKEMEVFSGVVRDKAPKPVKMPVAKPLPVKPVAPKPKPKPVISKKPIVKPAPVKPVIPKPTPEPVISKKPVVKPAPVKKPLPIIIKVPKIAKPTLPKPIKRKPVSKLPKGKHINFDFYGNPLVISTDPKFNKAHLGYKVNSDSISTFWSSLSKTNYEDTIKQLKKYKKPLQVNDWGYALLVNALSTKIYPRNKNKQNLFTWFVLLKSGYKARIAYNEKGIYMLFPSKQKIYAAAYFTFNNARYYSLSFDGTTQNLKGVRTYNGDYPNTDTVFDMQLTQALNTKTKDKPRKLSFKYRGKRHNLKVGLDKNVVHFFNTYPQLDIDLYFNSEVNKKIGTQLLTQLRPIINGKSEVEAVNTLLRFVQKSFKYKTDGNQFGKENYLFLEETIYYPYSDCEDRAVMFAWLVRSLLDTEVVGLSYPGHIAAAVHIKSNIPGDSFVHNGKKYMIADPTYINANMGQTMPDFRKHKPKVIKINAF